MTTGCVTAALLLLIIFASVEAENLQLSAVVTDLGCSTRPDGKTRDCLRQVECSDDPQSDRTFCPTRCDEAVESRVVRLANLVDSQPCRLGKTFGTKTSSGQFLLWVSKGCRARFRVSCSFAL